MKPGAEDSAEFLRDYGDSKTPTWRLSRPPRRKRDSRIRAWNSCRRPAPANNEAGQLMQRNEHGDRKQKDNRSRELMKESFGFFRIPILDEQPGDHDAEAVG